MRQRIFTYMTETSDSNETMSRELVVQNKMGIHARSNDGLLFVGKYHVFYILYLI